MTPQEAKIWYSILKRLYPSEDIEWCLKKAIKSANIKCLQKSASQTDVLWKESKLYKTFWKNIKIGFISFWFQQSNCNFTQQQIRILISNSFGHLKPITSVLTEDINAQLLDFKNNTLKKLIKANKSKQILDLYQKKWFPKIKLQRLLRVWPNPQFTDEQIRTFRGMEEVKLDESVPGSLDLFGMNVASFLTIYHGIKPSAAQLQHFIKCIFNAYAGQKDDCDQNWIYSDNEMKKIEKNDAFDDIEFDEAEWDEVDMETLVDKDALLLMNDGRPVREYSMMYLLKLDLQKLFKHLSEECHRLFEHIIAEINNDCIIQKTALVHFRSLMKTDLRSFGHKNMRSVLPNTQMKRNGFTNIYGAWYLNDKLDKFDLQYLCNQQNKKSDANITTYSTQNFLKSIDVHSGGLTCGCSESVDDFDYQMGMNQLERPKIKKYALDHLLATQNDDDIQIENRLECAMNRLGLKCNQRNIPPNDENPVVEMPRPLEVPMSALVSKCDETVCQKEQQKSAKSKQNKNKKRTIRIPNKKRKRDEFESNSVQPQTRTFKEPPRQKLRTEVEDTSSVSTAYTSATNEYHSVPPPHRKEIERPNVQTQNVQNDEMAQQRQHRKVSANVQTIVGLRCQKNHILKRLPVNQIDLEGWDWTCDGCCKTFTGDQIVYDCHLCLWGVCEQCAQPQTQCDILRVYDTNTNLLKMKEEKSIKYENTKMKQYKPCSKRYNKNSRRVIDSDSESDDGDDDEEISVKREPE